MQKLEVKKEFKVLMIIKLITMKYDSKYPKQKIF